MLELEEEEERGRISKQVSLARRPDRLVDTAAPRAPSLSIDMMLIAPSSDRSRRIDREEERERARAAERELS